MQQHIIVSELGPAHWRWKIIPRLGDRAGVYVKCEQCGEEVYKTQSQYKKRKHHFCSNKCQGAFNRELAFENRECEICGNTFYVSRKSNQRFCGGACQHEWQRRQVGSLNPRYDRYETRCENCGKTYMLNKARINGKGHKFCCVECRREWYRNVWSQDSEWKEESRKRATILLKDNPLTLTRPQVIVNTLLNSLDIGYINEQPFSYYSIDNYLNDYHLAIEVMGDFWHCNRMKYDVIKYTNQADSIRRDKAKRTYLDVHYGIPILYLWEDDIENRPDVITALILLFVSNDGKLQDYQSVNYRVENGVAVLNDERIVMYQEMSKDEIHEHMNIAS